MTIIDDIEERRAELRHCVLSALERREARQDTPSCCGKATRSIASTKTHHRPASQAEALCNHRPRRPSMDGSVRVAFERLLDLARSDTGQAHRAANFILALECRQPRRLRRRRR